MKTEVSETSRVWGKLSGEMPTKPYPMRLPAELLERVDFYLAHMNREHPGMNLNRTDVVRMALVKFLDEFERKSTPKKKSK